MFFDRPETKEAAHKCRYGAWAGNPRGNAFNAARCAEEVSAGSGSYHYCQCSRRPGYGPSGLFCKQHAKRLAERRSELVENLYIEAAAARSAEST